MRIISGKYRGKKLKEFELTSTRPTLDRVKESIFNLIQFDVLNAVVLDLFSGTGALGIEAISRGAKKTILIDKNPDAIKIIKENLKNIEGEFEVLNLDFLNYLNSNQQKFDIVLLDPPFASNFGEQAIEKIIENDILNKNGIIIFETNKDDLKFEAQGFKTTKKKYGTVYVYKLEREE